MNRFGGAGFGIRRTGSNILDCDAVSTARSDKSDEFTAFVRLQAFHADTMALTSSSSTLTSAFSSSRQDFLSEFFRPSQADVARVRALFNESASVQSRTDRDRKLSCWISGIVGVICGSVDRFYLALCSRNSHANDSRSAQNCFKHFKPRRLGRSESCQITKTQSFQRPGQDFGNLSPVNPDLVALPVPGHSSRRIESRISQRFAGRGARQNLPKRGRCAIATSAQ
jgi:hypothetical protein